MSAAEEQATLLLTGATGFVGGELLRGLRESGRVRCLVRDASRLDQAEWVEAVEADLGQIESLSSALEGIDEVYYLVHSMEPGVEGDFAEQDRRAAENFAQVAAKCGVRRAIYLGGVVPEERSSDHLDSRAEVERILAEAAPEFVSLRASMIVGAGSDSFGALVQLVERMPVLLMPTWRDQRSQPVAIDDVVEALMAARRVEPGTYDIAGPESLTFEEMTETVADILGQEHRSVPIPFSNSRVEAAVTSAVVDQDYELLRPLMSGLHADLSVEDNALKTVFGVEPTPFRAAAEKAISSRVPARQSGS